MSAAFPPVSQAGRQLAAGTVLTSAVHERPTPENCVTAFGTVAPRLAANGYRPIPITPGRNARLCLDGGGSASTMPH